MSKASKQMILFMKELDTGDYLDSPPPNEPSRTMKSGWSRLDDETRIEAWMDAFKRDHQLMLSCKSLDDFISATKSATAKDQPNQGKKTSETAEPPAKKRRVELAARHGSSSSTLKSSSSSAPPSSSPVNRRTPLPNSRSSAGGGGASKPSSSSSAKSSSKAQNPPPYQRQIEADDEDSNSEADDEDSFRIPTKHRRRAAAAEIRSTKVVPKRKATQTDPRAKTEVCISRLKKGDQTVVQQDLVIKVAAHCRQKLRQLTGVTETMDWPTFEDPEITDSKGQAMLRFDFDKPVDVSPNAEIRARAVEAIWDAEMAKPNFTAADQPYMTKRLVEVRVRIAAQNFATTYKTQRNDDKMRKAKAGDRRARRLGRQSTLALNLHKGLDDVCKQYPQIDKVAAKTIILDTYMSDSYSGPEDEQERTAWVRDVLKADKDRMGKRVTAYNKRGQGKLIFETMHVSWRTPEYQWLIDTCQAAFLASGKAKPSGERVSTGRWDAHPPILAPPSAIVSQHWLRSLQDAPPSDDVDHDDENERDVGDLVNNWVEWDDLDVVGVMENIREIMDAEEEEVSEEEREEQQVPEREGRQRKATAAQEGDDPDDSDTGEGPREVDDSREAAKNDEGQWGEGNEAREGGEGVNGNGDGSDSDN